MERGLSCTFPVLQREPHKPFTEIVAEKSHPYKECGSYANNHTHSNKQTHPGEPLFSYA